jgi:hypothetical protein
MVTRNAFMNTNEKATEHVTRRASALRGDGIGNDTNLHEHGGCPLLHQPVGKMKFFGDEFKVAL